MNQRTTYFHIVYRRQSATYKVSIVSLSLYKIIERSSPMEWILSMSVCMHESKPEFVSREVDILHIVDFVDGNQPDAYL